MREAEFVRLETRAKRCEGCRSGYTSSPSSTPGCENSPVGRRALLNRDRARVADRTRRVRHPEREVRPCSTRPSAPETARRRRTSGRTGGEVDEPGERSGLVHRRKSLERLCAGLSSGQNCDPRRVSRRRWKAGEGDALWTKYGAVPPSMTSCASWHVVKEPGVLTCCAAARSGPEEVARSARSGMSIVCVGGGWLTSNPELQRRPQRGRGRGRRERAR